MEDWTGRICTHSLVMLEKSALKAGLQNCSAMSSGCVALHTAKSVNAKAVPCNVGPSGIFLEI